MIAVLSAPACGAWNTVVEQEAAPKTKSGRSAGTMRGGFHTVKAVSITEVDAQEEIRFSTGMGELDRVLGGGAVKGSLVLVGGAPGVGKSTAMGYLPALYFPLLYNKRFDLGSPFQGKFSSTDARIVTANRV